jgi:hypothetical protein
MICISIFEDLREKTNIISPVNADARAVSSIIEPLVAAQKPFESTLIDQLKSKNLISELQSQKLKSIIVHRNKAAHPSGHLASAEEARYVYFEAIDKFLSVPDLGTTHIADSILKDLENSNFFPDSNMANIKNIVEDNIRSMHESAYVYLVKKLRDRIVSTNKIISANSERFILGLSRIDNESAQKAIANEIVKTKLIDENYSTAIFNLISANGALLTRLDTTTKKRLNTLFGPVIDGTPSTTSVSAVRHPIKLLNQMSLHVDYSTIKDFFAGCVEKITDKYLYNSAILTCAGENSFISDKIYSKLFNNAGSSNFTIANEFAKSVVDMDDLLSIVYEPHNLFKLLIQVEKAANYGAFDSRRLVGAKFNTLPRISAVIIKDIRDNSRKYRDTLQDVGQKMNVRQIKNYYFGI